MATSDNAQKTPFWLMIEQYVDKRIKDHLQLQPKKLPVTVTKVDKEFVYVQPDIQSKTYTFPTMKATQAFSAHAREPTQAGAKGFVEASDYYVGGVSNYSGGQADLYPRGNLTTLVFQPVSSDKFSSRDYDQYHVQGGPKGVHIENANGQSFHDLDQHGKHTLQSGDNTHVVTVDKENKKITFKVPFDADHKIYLGGDGVEGSYSLIPGSINVYIRTG